VRLVVDREREIEAFVSKEYWTIEVELIKEKSTGRARPRPFTASLVQIDGQKPDLTTKEAAERVVDDLKRAAFSVSDVREREVQRSPSAPFTTSTLQQEASRKLGFSAKRTMAVAQQLYEGVNFAGEGSVGLITYMRTDSTNVAPSAQAEALSYIRATYGPEFVPGTPRVYRTKSKGAQEAHEAIRPTDPRRTAESMKGEVTSDQAKLYKLIWQRMIASQMANSIYDSVTVDVANDQVDGLAAYLLRATGSTVKFKGFAIVYTEGRDDGGRDEEAQRPLPPVVIGDRLRSNSVIPAQHFTQPPPRYTDATLVKTLEENGVGRPSTYAPTLSTIQDRGYVERQGRQMLPTELGRVVTDLLVEHFPDIVDVQFTAGMEEKLDDVANDDVTWVSVLDAFYPPFADRLRQADHDIVQVLMQPELAGEDCPNCGSPMLIKHGRFGKFIACSNFPACKTAKSFLIKVGQPCPLCLVGELVEKRSRRGRLFYGCSRHPDCGFMAWQRPLPTPCPECGGILTESGRDNAKCLSCNAVVRRPETEVEQLVEAAAGAR
jgi:DNA topoisomerase-1